MGRVVGTLFVLRSADGAPVHVQVASALVATLSVAEAAPAAVTCFGRVARSGSPRLHPSGQDVAFQLSKAHLTEDFPDPAHRRQIEAWVAERAAGAEAKTRG